MENIEMEIKEFEPEASIHKGQLEYIEMRPSKNGGYLRTTDVMRWLNEPRNKTDVAGKYLADLLQKEIDI